MALSPAERAANRRWYEANKARSHGYVEAWRRRNPEKAKAITYANTSNKRARKLGIDEKLYGRDVVLLDGPCRYCGGARETWDHVTPLSLGGRNHVSNLVESCHPCNWSKGRRAPTADELAMLDAILALRRVPR